MVGARESETTGGMSAAEMPAAAARQRERREEDGTGKRRRNGGTPNMTGHGLFSLRVSRAGHDFGSNEVVQASLCCTAQRGGRSCDAAPQIKLLHYVAGAVIRSPQKSVTNSPWG
jgi:hypothetical protein